MYKIRPIYRKTSNNVIFVFLLSLIMLFASCNRTILPKQGEIIVSWEVISNTYLEKPAVKVAFEIENNSKMTLNDKNWELYFNQAARTLYKTDDETAKVERISGDWYRVVPEKDFILKPGDKTSIIYECSHWFIKKSDAPVGLYFVFHQPKKDDHILETDCIIKPFERPEQVNRHKNDHTPLPTPSFLYEENKKLSLLTPDKLLPFVPSPVSISKTGNIVSFSTPLNIYYDPKTENEAVHLKNMLENILKGDIMIMQGQSNETNAIDLVLDFSDNSIAYDEAYKLVVDKNANIRITASTNKGLFYGVQSLLGLLPVELFLNPSDNFQLEVLTINDKPRFGYRGVHIDVARNFQSKEMVFKIIDILAFYKINTLHIHLTDDEGWRLEIPGLPELTKVGSFRVHTEKDANAVHPSYGSGPFAHSPGKSGSGFYTRGEFLEILKYAAKHHIRIIPEVNFPGHARAAIKAMETRYHKYLKSGDEVAANEFRLIDPEDTSEYISAQLFDDNVVNIALESVYNFIDKVIGEIANMYIEAELPFKILHIGGDEVANGAWLGSPIVKEKIDKSVIERGTANLHAEFTAKVLDIFAKYGLQMSGWEEVGLIKDINGKFIPNKKFSGGAVIPYVWNNLWGSQDLAYRLANSDFPVVLCHVANFYFDMAYNKDPEESGLYWGGFVDTYNAWHYSPFNVFSTTLQDQMGNKIDTEVEYKNMERLKPEARKNIMGIQAQHWAETILNHEILEYYILPKLLGLAESAWSKERIWEYTDNPLLREKQVDDSWNVFANTLAQKELPRLSKLFGGFNYRIPPPGAKIIDGNLFVNTSLPGLIVKYTDDGSEVEFSSKTWIEPFVVSDKEIKLKTYDISGKSGKTVIIMQ